MLEIKTCQPIIAAFESSTLTLVDIKLAIPEATEAHLISLNRADVSGASLYLYYVYAGEVATFKKPGPYGDRSHIAIKDMPSAIFELSDGDQDIVLPTSKIAYYVQYNH